MCLTINYLNCRCCTIFCKKLSLIWRFFGSSAFEVAHQKWIEQGGESMLNGAVSYGRNFIEFLLGVTMILLFGLGSHLLVDSAICPWFCQTFSTMSIGIV